MFNKKNFLAIATIFLSSAIANAEIPIEIVRGARPTSAKTTCIVAKTTPGAVATINGEPAKVYATGCFGANIDLAEGENNIQIEVNHKGETATKVVTIVRESKATTKTTVSAPKYKEVLFTAVTRPGAFLQYGDGTDRLGGSKMGFIDEKTPLKIIGDYDNLYKVKLSQNRFAYVQKEYVEIADAEIATVNSGSISLSNAGNIDRVSISLPARLPYYSWTEVDPSTICLEIFGATCNSNWITQRGTPEMVEYVDFRQVDSDVLRLIIKLKKKYAWGYDIHYTGNTLTMSVKHTPSLNLKDLTIGLDAGHGGKNPGAIGNSGLKESVVNLQLVMQVKEQLEAKGAKVVLSRSDDSDISMTERKRIFKEANVDLMISIHNNSGGSPLVEMGASTYYKHIANRELASIMRDKLTAIGLKDWGLTGNFNFSLNMPTEYPNVLLEVLFMSSLPDEEKLCDPAWHKKIGKQVVSSLEEYLKKVKADK